MLGAGQRADPPGGGAAGGAGGGRGPGPAVLQPTAGSCHSGDSAQFGQAVRQADTVIFLSWFIQ